MSEFDQIKLRRLDGTLLLVFLGLLRHRRAVRVAEELGLTPSTISHALARLRDIFGDELFLRRAEGFDPTAEALRLGPEVEAALLRLDRALAGAPAFDPATAEATLRLSALDYEVAALFPRFVARLAAVAPGLRVAVRSADAAAALRLLAEGQTDLALGFFWAPPDWAIARPLLTEDYLTAARAGHPLLAAPTLEAFCAARHLVVAPAGEMAGIVDAALARAGRARTVAVAVPQFFAGLALVAEGDLVATLPRRIVERHGARFGLAWVAPPIELRRFTSSVLRHRRNERSPLLSWVADELAAAAEGL
jgi:DNA-binding transcriptional LysR family regulator